MFSPAGTKHFFVLLALLASAATVHAGGLDKAKEYGRELRKDPAARVTGLLKKVFANQ